MATFTNTATLSYNGTSTVSNTVTGEILNTLSVTKTAVRSTYGCDDTVTYVISLINSGTTALTELTLNDNLGSYLCGETTRFPLVYKAGSLNYFVNGVPTTAPTIASTEPLRISGITVPASSSTIVVYETELTAFAPRETGGTILNTVTVSGLCTITPITAEETVTAESAPCLSITKSLSPTTVIQNGELTYTFLIENSGNTAATVSDAVFISDVFVPILCDITVTLNGTALERGTDYSYNSETGAFETVQGRITVPAATYSRNAETCAVTVTPGTTELTVTGRICC